MVQTGIFDSSSPIIYSLRDHGLLDKNDDSQHTGAYGRFKVLYMCVYGPHFTLRSECVYMVLILP